ncbi:MAG: DinB family protein [Bacteroidetes bacterium]|nr:DinB family protein [Bacteroidota bacterium]
MNPTIDTIKKTRSFLISLLEGLSLDQLNKIPSGFNNNIIWNLGHLIAAQQGLCYMRSGLKPRIEESFFLAYKTDSKPERDVTPEEFETMKKLLTETLDMLEADLQQNLFTNYNSVTTRYGVEIKNVDDAIKFLLFHEGLHCGYIMALKRMIK